MIPYEQLSRLAQALLTHIFNEHAGALRFSVRQLGLALRADAFTALQASAAIEECVKGEWLRRDPGPIGPDMTVSLTPRGEAQLFVVIRPQPKPVPGWQRTRPAAAPAVETVPKAAARSEV